MKKLIILILIIISAKATFSQQICGAEFQYWVDTQNGVVTCADSSFLLPGYTITSNQWTIRGGGMVFTFSDTTTCSFNYTPAGIYDICYTIRTENRQTGDTCGSTNCYTITIGNNCNIQISTAIINESMQGAHDGAIDLTVTGGYPPYSFLWSNGAITEDISSLSSGTYVVYIRSVNDTSWCNHFNVFVGLDSSTVPCNLIVSAVVNHVSVIGGNDGSIDLMVTGGTPPYTFFWNTGAVTEDISQLTAGRYMVAIGSADTNCFATYEAWIIEPYMDSIFVDTLQTSILDTCFGFTVDTFYISSVTVNGNTVTTHWVFVGGGAIFNVDVDYVFSNFGSQLIVLTVNCSPKKLLTTYTTYINIRSGMGVINHFNESALYISPNPCGDRIKINNPGDTHGIVRFKLYNNNGMLIRTFSGGTDGYLDTGDLPAGLYLLKVTDLNTMSERKGKFIRY